MRPGMLILGGLFLVGCLGGDGNGDGSGSVAGDWFICDDAACDTIDDDGVRLNPDGTWIELKGDDQPVTGDPTCVELDDGGGSYTWDGEILRLVRSGMAMARYATLDGDRLTLSGVPMGEDGADGGQVIYFIRLETHEEVACPNNDDAPGAIGGDSTSDEIPLDAGI